VCCLRSLAQLMKNDILDPIIDYAGPLLASKDDKEVYIGLMSLGAILMGPQETVIVD